MQKLFRRIRYWAGSRRAKADLAEEMELHRALKQEELERNGMSAKDAAGASLGNVSNIHRATGSFVVPSVYWT